MTRATLRRRCLVLVLAAVLPCASRGAEPAKKDAARLDAIVVTGTHLRRVELEGALPVTVVDRGEWERAGAASVADVLRSLPWNSSGNGGELPNSSLPTASQPRLRGLGSKYTLVLLDGHRLPGYSAIEGGAAANVTGLPMAAIDRVEVLREGASAVYGSDAIGGVINFITRRDAATQLTLHRDHPGEPGGGMSRAGFVASAARARDHGLLALEWLDREPLFGAQRDALIEHTALSTFGDPGSFRRRNPATGAILDFFQPDPRCPAALDGAEFPQSTLLVRGPARFCGYRFRDLNMERAALRARSLFASGGHDFDDGLQAFARALVVDADSLTQLAPTPVTGIEIAADNPVNPTLGERGPGLGFPIQLNYRTSALGPRVTAADEASLHLLAGLEGNLGDGTWRVHALRNLQRSRTLGRSGYALRGAFTAAIARGDFNPFTALPGDATGLQGALHAPSSDSRTRSDGAGAVIEFDAPAWRGVESSHAIGVDMRRDHFDAVADARTQAGEVLGQGEIPPRQRSVGRNYGAAYFESVWRPGATLEVNAAARYDRYQDAGGAFSPKLGIAWRPWQTVLVRASAGRGFQAPDLVSAYGGFAGGSALVIDPTACAARLADPVACAPDFVEVSLVPNDQLGPERARQGSVGVAWDATPALHVGLDYVHTRIVDEIGRLDARDALRNEFDCARGSSTCDPVRDGQVRRDANGNIDGVVLPRINIAGTRLRALDGEVEARLGDFRLQLRASRLLQHERQVQATLPRQQLAGATARPRWRGQLQLDWQRGSHGATLGAAFTARQRNCTYLASSDGVADATCNGEIPSHLVLDAQWRWQAPWDATLALGLRNLADREPAFDVLGNFAYGLYDPTGRTAYLRYDQPF